MSVTPERLGGAIVALLDYGRLGAAIDIERLGEVIAHRLERPAGEWVSARELEARHGRPARYFRDRKELFGARPKGDGPKPRLEFEAAYVARVLAERRAA